MTNTRQEIEGMSQQICSNGRVRGHNGLYDNPEYLKKLKTKKNIGKNNHKWKGGKKMSRYGYVYVWLPECERRVFRYILEHRLVMEKHIGRKLLASEVVHHINGIRTDNRIENLVLFKNKSEHRKYHNSLKSSPLQGEKGKGGE